MSDVEYSDEEFFDDEDDEMLGQDDDDSASDADMADSGVFETFKTDTKTKEKSYDVSHADLTQEAVEKIMAEDVENISGMFGVEVCHAALF
jgi:ariadne-1